MHKRNCRFSYIGMYLPGIIFVVGIYFSINHKQISKVRALNNEIRYL